MQLMDDFHQLAEKETVTALTEHILEASGYWAQLNSEKTEEAVSRQENVREFLTKTKEYDQNAEEPSLVDFLSEVSLVTDLDKLEDGDEAAVVMTMHSAKGLEFPYVFLVGLEEGIFPMPVRFIRSGNWRRNAVFVMWQSRERKKRLYLVNAERRSLYGRSNANPPSRFFRGNTGTSLARI